MRNRRTFYIRGSITIRNQDDVETTIAFNEPIRIGQRVSFNFAHSFLRDLFRQIQQAAK